MLGNQLAISANQMRMRTKQLGKNLDAGAAA
jgi:hypothetical protein